MRPTILIANPNTSAHITEAMVACARNIAGSRADVQGVTAHFGAPALETPQDLAEAELAVQVMLDNCRDCDGALIAAFGDPGLGWARKRCRIPVEGLGEAGLMAAAEGGRRFAIITLGPAMKSSVIAKVDRLGLSSQVTGINFLACGVLDLAREPEQFLLDIALHAEQAALRHGAEAVLLAGAPFAGLAGQVARNVSIPVFEGVSAAMERLLERRAAP